MVLLASLAQLGWAEETEFGETPTATAQTGAFGILREKVSLPDPKRAYDIYRVIGSLSRIPSFVDRNELVHEGSIPFTMQNGKALVFGLGKSVKVGSVAPFTHTIQTDSSLPSMCIEALIGDGTTDYMRYYTGTKVNRMTLEGTEKGVIKCILDVISKKGYKGTGSKSTVETVTTKPYQFHHTSTNLTLWTSGVFARVLNWSLTIDNHLEPNYYWQDTDAELPYEIDEEEQTVELKATIIPSDLDIFDHIGVATEFDLDMVISRTASTDTIEIKNPTASKCVMPEAPHPLPEKGRLATDVLIYMKGLEIIVVDAISAYPNETGP